MKLHVLGDRAGHLLNPLNPLLLVFALGFFAVLPARAHADPVDCPPMQQPLVKIPEMVTKDGRLRGTFLLTDEQQRIAFRTPPQSLPGDLSKRTATTCFPQYMRAFHIGTAEALSASRQKLVDPLPGPTLRARLGDMIELTFLNNINPNDFGNSIDMDLKSGGTGCDETSGLYPGKDTFPDCFHGSSTGNIHFHGTHTNPNTTGDNVLIQVRPSNAQLGPDPVTATTYQKPFDEFFAKCEAMLKGHPLAEWPAKWSDLPTAFTDDQKKRLVAYDAQAKQDLRGMDQKALDAGQWPEYYIGAYPYCFQLPKYTDSTYPPPGGNSALQMGQSPGTHWYHAHKHGSTNIDVQNGMSGVFVIEGEYDDALSAFYNKVPNWTRTQPVMLVNQLGGTPNLEHPSAGRTDKGPDFSVNGRLQPKIQMHPGEVQMWRIANSSPRSAMYVPYLPEGFTWRQLAQDGVQFAPDNYEKSENKPLKIAAGNRVDLLVKAPAKPHQLMAPVIVEPNIAAAEITIVPNAQTIGYLSAPPPPVPLLWVEVSGQGPEMQLIPKEKLAPLPKYLTDITDDQVKNTRTITFASGPPRSAKQHTIDGMQFSETDKSDWVQVKDLNTVEEWTIVNNTTFQPIDHPFHIHINPFQITEVFDPNQVVNTSNGPAYKYVLTAGTQLAPGQCYIDPQKPDTWKPCDSTPTTQRIWWDVFPIPSGRSATDANGSPINGPDGKQIVIGGHFKMRSRFVDFPGVYVLHCHILAHEDRGMMTIVAVAQPPAALENVHHH